MISFRCTQCQAPLSAPPEMAGRKAKCRQCAQLLVVPNPERDRWPPGMEPPSSKPPVERATPQQVPLQQRAARPVARPAPSLPSTQSAASATPPAQPVIKPVSAPQPVMAAPVSVSQQNAGSAIPVAKAVPVAPSVPAARASKSMSPPVAETVPDDLDAFLDLERTAPALPSSPEGESNPYRAPQTAESYAATSASGEIRRITIGETLGTVWRIFKAQGGSLVGVTLISAVLIAVVFGLHWVLVTGLGAVLGALEIRSRPLVFAIVMMSLFVLVAGITFVFLGYLRYVLLIARGKTADLATLLSAGPVVLPGMLAGLCYLVAVVAGSLLIVGGLIAGLLFALSPVVLIDQQRGALQSLVFSARLMWRNLLPAFLLLFMMGMLGNLSTLLTGGLGVFLVVPLQALLWCVIYLRATGRRTAID